MKQLRWFIPLILLTACQQNPRGILSRSKMEDVIYDLTVADGVLWAKHLQFGHEDACQAVYQQLMEDHCITRAQFDSSMVYYNTRPNILDRIYIHVEERMQKKRADAQLMSQFEADYNAFQHHLSRFELDYKEPYFPRLDTMPTPQKYYETLSQQPTLLPDPATFQYRR